MYVINLRCLVGSPDWTHETNVCIWFNIWDTDALVKQTEIWLIRSSQFNLLSSFISFRIE